MAYNDPISTHDDGTVREGPNQAHPNPVRAQEWYAWEQERNRARRLQRIGRGCAFVVLVVIAVLAAIGLATVMGWR